MKVKKIDSQTLLNTMLEANSINNEPLLGIFWYDDKSHSLVGVRSIKSSEISYTYSKLDNVNLKTIGELHKNVWKIEKYKNKNLLFQEYYTQVPRGRVFEIENVGFIVYTGSWIKHMSISEQTIQNLIMSEFNLPANTTFEYDNHWDIGHGWSTD